MKTHPLAHCLFLCALMLLFWGVSCKEVTGPGEELPQTPDTTSHDWQWTITTLGDGGSSALYDVAIINDSLAYAVGEIYLRDSITGQLDPIKYNVAKWDGKGWTLQRVFYVASRDNISAPVFRSILAFGENDVWAFSADVANRWNGAEWISTFNSPVMFGFGWINKAWGTSSSNFYVVGNNGNLAHYDGSVWRRLNSGTGFHIADIYGDSSNGSYEILAVALNGFNSYDRLILSIKGSKVDSIPAFPIQYELTGIWFQKDKHYWITGAGVHHKNKLEELAWKERTRGSYFTSQIHANNWNDILTAGSGGEVMHYNGSTWKNYEAQIGLYGNYYGLRMKGELAIGVGQMPVKAIILIGKRK
ncbi:MAG: hypothetical protein SFU91_11395 [Chloroherpetonaceae bacterium]|nr:hypothetical protein [Chloroherpetonaceae bacterium]